MNGVGWKKASGQKNRKHHTARFWRFPRKFSTRTFKCMNQREFDEDCSSLEFNCSTEQRAKSEGVLSSADEVEVEIEEDAQTVDRLDFSGISIPTVLNCLRTQDSLISPTATATATATAITTATVHSSALPLHHSKEKSRVGGPSTHPGVAGSVVSSAGQMLRGTKNSVSVAEANGNPPAGYLWIWLGVLRRWHRNYFLLETPGVLTHSRHQGSQMKGAFCLRDARVIASHGHSRQFCIVSPAGVAYLRSMRKDQRGAWLSEIRASIEKYTQCIQQAEKMNNVQGSLVYVEPEQAKLAMEVKNRMRARLNELEPYKEALRKDLNQLETKIHAIKELLGGDHATTPYGTSSHDSSSQEMEFSQKRSSIRSNCGRCLSTAPATPMMADVGDVAMNKKEHSPKATSKDNARSSAGRVDRERLIRHPSFKDGLQSLHGKAIKVDSPRHLAAARSSNFSADDLLLSTSAPLDVLMENHSRVGSKSLTPRPSDKNGLSYVHYIHNEASAPGIVMKCPEMNATATTTTMTASSSSSGTVKHESGYSTNRKHASDLGSPFLGGPETTTHTIGEQSTILIGNGLWGTFRSYTQAVENALFKEAQATMELKAENSALRKLLQKRHTSEIQGGEDQPTPLISGSTSRSYSTAESEFDANLLENSDDEDDNNEDDEQDDSFDSSLSRASNNLGHIEEDQQSKEELLDALEVVRRADYVTRNSTKSVALVVNLSNALLPKQYEEEDDDSESQNENEDCCCEELSGSNVLVRTRLPAPQPIQRGFNIWGVLKNVIGRDLTRITMPATINEPLSALQRLVEDFEHVSFLEKAAFCACPNERLLYVTAFMLSSYNAGLLRDCKPFNPLLGETFEWSNEHFHFLGEQVSHHPPVSCFKVKGFNPNASAEKIYEVHGEFELRSKFWGTSVIVFPTGRMELFLETTNERYVWNKANISIHNLVLGQLWLDFHGDITVRNQTTGGCAKIRLAKARGPQLDRGNLEGKIFTPSGEEFCVLDGNFTNSIYAKKILSYQGLKPSGNTGPSYGEKEEIYRAIDLPVEASYQYNMTPFAVGLNHIQSTHRTELPKTDSRFRTDVRGLEEGNINFATSEKLRLEEKQRQARKARKGNGQKYMPMWFTLRQPSEKEYAKVVENDEVSAWQFRDEYWIRKEEKNWAGCPDIY